MIAWLKDLKQKGYLSWIYDSGAARRNEAAVYYLSISGIRFLRASGCPADELRKRYRDSNRQPAFIDRCLLLAACCLHLEAKNKGDDATLHYDYACEADYTDPDNAFSYLSDNEFIQPDLACTKQVGLEGDSTSQTYLMQLLPVSTPRYMVKQQLKGYIEYWRASEWEELHGDDNVPIILVACPTLAELIYAKRYVRQQLIDLYDDDIPEDIPIRFTTTDKLRSKGLTAVIWEEV